MSKVLLKCIICSLKRVTYKAVLSNSYSVSFLKRNEGYFIGCSVLNVKSPIFNAPLRCYAKGKDKKKEKGKVKVEVNEAMLAELINIESLRKNMEKAIELLKADYIRHLSIRSTAGSIELIPVTFEEKEYTLQELAQIVRKNPKTVVVNMSIFPQAIPAALQALQKSGMNLNPQQDGTTLYIPVPTVTKEHRESLAKNAKNLFIKCKDAIRDIQNKHTKSLKRKESVSLDDIRNYELQINVIADQYIAQATIIMESKQEELVGKQ